MLLNERLGRALALHNVHDVELANRLARAWAKYSVYKHELTDKSYSLRQRLRLFEATVTPSVLYGCASWTMTRAREDALRTTQRRMLRQILGKGRRVLPDDASSSSSDDSSEDGSATDASVDRLESWVEWIQRVTAEAEERLSDVGGRDWVEEQRRRKWRWAGHVCRRTDGRWTRAILEWQPSGNRDRRRPNIRWTDSICSFMAFTYGGDSDPDAWKGVALDWETWASLEQDYASFCETD